MSYVKTTIIAILAVVLLCSIMKCKHDVKEKDKQISSLQLEKQLFNEQLNKLGQTVYTQEAIISSDKQSIKSLTDSVFNLKSTQERRVKEVIAYYKGKTKTEIKEKLVPFVDSAATKKWEDSVASRCAEVIQYYTDSTIRVPRVATDSNSLYSANLTATKEGIRIDSLIVPDTQYVRFVTKKRTFWQFISFKPRRVEVQVLHTNPLIKVTGQNSAVYIPKKKSNVLGKAILIGVGIFIGTKL